MPSCTYCKGTEFFEGPSGGLSTNILCANNQCRHWFNYSPMMDRLEDLNKVEPTEAEKGAQRAKEKARQGQKMRAEIAEGEALYTAGMPVEDCFIDEAKGSYGNAALTFADAHRLAGWLIAHAEDK